MAKRILYFLYGMPNIVGSALGLVGLGLYFTGIINDYWYLIVLALYLAGVFAIPNPERYRFSFDRMGDANEIKSSLRNLLDTLKKRVANEIVVKIEQIVEHIISVLPSLQDYNDSASAVYTIRETALSYLPQTMENYLKLPRAYASFHPHKNGKTAKDLLLEQLNILEREMQDIVIDIHKNDIDNIEAHGRFLREKFQRSALFS